MHMPADAFARFMDKALEPGVIRPADRGRRPIDVRRLEGVQPQLLQAFDDVENDFLSALEAEPRSQDTDRYVSGRWKQESFRTYIADWERRRQPQDGPEQRFERAVRLVLAGRYGDVDTACLLHILAIEVSLQDIGKPMLSAIVSELRSREQRRLKGAQ